MRRLLFNPPSIYHTCPLLSISQTVRRGLDAGDLARPGASETATQRLDLSYVDMEAVPAVARVGSVAAGAAEMANGVDRGVQDELARPHIGPFKV